jgi:hypothetical protein
MAETSVLEKSEGWMAAAGTMAAWVAGIQESHKGTIEKGYQGHYFRASSRNFPLETRVQ